MTAPSPLLTHFRGMTTVIEITRRPSLTGNSVRRGSLRDRLHCCHQSYRSKFRLRIAGAKAYSFLLGSELTTGIVLKIDGGHALI